MKGGDALKDVRPIEIKREGADNMATCYLMDLERTLAYGKPYFWKSSRYGYTDDIKRAGRWQREICDEIVKRDIHKETIIITEELIEKVLGKDIVQHEESIID